MTDAEKIVLITVATTIFKESVFNLHNNAYIPIYNNRAVSDQSVASYNFTSWKK